MGRFSSEVIEPSGGLEFKDVILMTTQYFEASLHDELEKRMTIKSGTIVS